MRIEVTTANMNLTWDRLAYGYAVTGTGPITTAIDCFTGLGISLGTTGVKSTTQTVSASTGRSATDKLAFMLGWTNGAMSVQSVTLKPSQNIDTPVNQVGGGRTTKNTRAFPLGTEIGMNMWSPA